ncbi:HMA domain-containing protein [Psidium guajava]|nr:HMA domain-containing protein [Psidium guajava]
MSLGHTADGDRRAAAGSARSSTALEFPLTRALPCKIAGFAVYSCGFFRMKNQTQFSFFPRPDLLSCFCFSPGTGSPRFFPPLVYEFSQSSPPFSS